MKNALPKYAYAKPGGGVYFQRRRFKTVRFQSEPGTAEFAAEYRLILRGRAPAPQGKTLRDFAISYQQSDRYTRLSPRSKRDYSRVLDYIKTKLRHLPADRMQRKDVIRAQESNKDAVRFANYFVQVIRAMFEHAIDIGWRQDNPAVGTRMLKADTAPRLPWPQDKIDAFRVAAEHGSRHRLIFELLLGTGQRIGDVLRCVERHLGRRHQRPAGENRRSALDTIDADLRTTPKAGLTICAQPNGKPTSYDGTWSIMMVRGGLGFSTSLPLC